MSDARKELGAGHTPGPWITDPVDPSEVFGADGFSVAECGGVHIVLNPDGTKHPSEPGQSVERSWPEECANARLIAAAPELLEALTLAVAVLEEADFRLGYAKGSLGQLEMADAKSGAYAAISKAEGAS